MLLISADSEESCSVAVGGLLRDWPELEGLDRMQLQLEQLGQEIRNAVNNIYITEKIAQCTLCEHCTCTLHTAHCTLHTAH